MNIQKTIRKKLNKPHPTIKEIPTECVKLPGKASALTETANLASTMPLPLVSIIPELDVKSSSHLEIMLPGQLPKRVELGRGQITIGRDENCSIQLPLTSISRRHAGLSAKGENYIIEDLNSTNGILVNGVRISRCVLRNNDQINIGDARLQFIQQKFTV